MGIAKPTSGATAGARSVASGDTVREGGGTANPAPSAGASVPGCVDGIPDAGPVRDPRLR